MTTTSGGYVPFLTNRAFAMHMDTVMIAEEMNQYHTLDLSFSMTSTTTQSVRVVALVSPRSQKSMLNWS